MLREVGDCEGLTLRGVGNGKRLAVARGWQWQEVGDGKRLMLQEVGDCKGLTLQGVGDGERLML